MFSVSMFGYTKLQRWSQWVNKKYLSICFENFILSIDICKLKVSGEKDVTFIKRDQE